MATAPALVLVGYLMFTQVKDIDVNDLEEGLPALLTMILMPLTYDITVGIGAGFMSVGVHQGRSRQDVGESIRSCGWSRSPSSSSSAGDWLPAFITV